MAACQPQRYVLYAVLTQKEAVVTLLEQHCVTNALKFIFITEVTELKSGGGFRGCVLL